MATGAMYHFSFLIKLYRRGEKSKPAGDSDNFEKLHALCFAELVSYIESLRGYPSKVPVMEMPHLCQLYTRRLEDLGVVNPTVHSTRLREKIFRAVPELVPTFDRKKYDLMFDKDMGEGITKACTHDSGVLNLAKTAQLIRKGLFHTHTLHLMEHSVLTA